MDDEDGLRTADEIFKDTVNAMMMEEVKTLLHFCQYDDIENKLIDQIDNWRSELLQSMTVLKPDLSKEDKSIIINKNINILPADKTPAQADHTKNWLQNLETPPVVTITSEKDLSPIDGNVNDPANNEISLHDGPATTDIANPQDPSAGTICKNHPQDPFADTFREDHPQDPSAGAINKNHPQESSVKSIGDQPDIY